MKNPAFQSRVSCSQLINRKISVTFKRVGRDALLFKAPLFPAMAIFLKGISIGLGARGQEFEV